MFFFSVVHIIFDNIHNYLTHKPPKYETWSENKKWLI